MHYGWETHGKLQAGGIGTHSQHNNRFADTLAILNFKLTFVEEQSNIVVIKREAQTINASFLEEAPKGDVYKETVRRELSKPSREFNVKCLKKYINVTGTLCAWSIANQMPRTKRITKAVAWDL